jgi:FKBP-type peptidyl-prolyl cis-trans isomerase FklB
MRKLIKTMLCLGAAATLSLGTLQAQTTTQTPPAAGAPAAPAAKTPSAKTPATAAKPGTATAKAPLALTTSKQKASYAIGMNIGKTMKKDGVDIDTTILARGMRDAIAGNKPLLTDDEAKAALTELQASMQKQQETKSKAAALLNKKAGDAFLAANKTKEGIVTLPSGLQYKIIKQGTGPKPTAADTVVCNYKGTLIDNTEFDSSYKRGQPASFPVGQVIKGWTEALQLMPVGSQWELFVPPDLGYGERGTPGGPIGPDSTLIFQVELLSIKPKEAPKGDAAPASKEQAPANPATQPAAKP